VTWPTEGYSAWPCTFAPLQLAAYALCNFVFFACRALCFLAWQRCKPKLAKVAGQTAPFLALWKQKGLPMPAPAYQCDLMCSWRVGSYTYIYAYIGIHTHIHTYVRAHVHTYIHTYTHTHICMHAYIHTYIHTHIHTYTHTHTYACMHAACMHTYIHVHPLISLHTQKRSALFSRLAACAKH
jgi:hypothetical protein